MTGADQQQQLQNYIERILVVFSDRQYFIQCLSACCPHRLDRHMSKFSPAVGWWWTSSKLWTIET